MLVIITTWQLVNIVVTSTTKHTICVTVFLTAVTLTVCCPCLVVAIVANCCIYILSVFGFCCNYDVNLEYLWVVICFVVYVLLIRVVN